MDIGLSSDEGLYEPKMSEFISNIENNDGLCISVVNGKLVKFSEKKISEWFEVTKDG